VAAAATIWLFSFSPHLRFKYNEVLSFEPPSDEAFTVEREAICTVAEPVEGTVRRRKQRQNQKPKRQPPYHVVLWDDDEHTYAYVIAMLQELFGHTVEKAFQLAKEVDTRSRVVVLTTTKEHAELKRDQIQAYGKDDLIAGCKGSMYASIEPSES
jgi:ATP-dependent Clp protease adaptor protein ClpS